MALSVVVRVAYTCIRLLHLRSVISRHISAINKRVLDLDLVPPTPAGASGDELSPFHTVVGGFGCAVPRHAHLVEVFSKCLSPGLFWPSLFPPAHSWCPCHCYLCRSLLWQTQYVPRESSPSFDHYVLQVLHFSHLHQFFICDVISPGYAEYRPQTPAVE